MTSYIKKVYQRFNGYFCQLRDFSFLIHHLTWKKIINFTKVNIQYLLRKTKVNGYPYILFIDPGNICNLRCPQCPTGLHRQGRKPGFMQFEDFQKIIDQLAEYAIFVSISNWGEPFLNKDIFKMTKYAYSKNIGTFISSNFTTVSEEEINEIIDSQLEHLTISIDGASQETYSKYRIGGDFNRVIRNIKLLVAKKKHRNSKRPFIRWQFIINRYNEHEIKKSKVLAKEIGVDLISYYTRFKILNHLFSFDTIEAEKWIPQINREHALDYSKPYLVNKHCYCLWRMVVVNYDGGISPCCGTDDEKTDFGNILNEDFPNIWNNRYYQCSRSVFRKNGKKSYPNFETVCCNCRVFKKPIQND